MPASKTFEIAAKPHTRAVLADAIAQFAHAAYPPGCSDCGQMARDALLTTAKQVAGTDDKVSLRVRQRRLIMQAVEWYCDNIEEPSDLQRNQMKTSMLALLRGEAVDEEIFLRPS